jgi:hypothetical protein
MVSDYRRGLGKSRLLDSSEHNEKTQVIKSRTTEPHVITITLLDRELDELIECVANAADRAESSAYDMAGTPKAKQLAVEIAKRLYALASRLQAAR